MNLLKGLFGLGALALLASYGGALHPAGDSFAVFRLPVALILCCIVPLFRPWRLRGIFWACLAAVLIPLGWGAAKPQPEVSGDVLVLYQNNLLYSRDHAANSDWIESVLSSGADVVTLQEVSEANFVLMAQLREAYPYQLHCPLNPLLGEAILSRYPPVEGSAACSKPDAFALMQVRTEVGPVWLVSVHLNWPWPKHQASQVTAVLPQLETVQGHPVVMAGDFNSVAWSWTVRRMGQAVGAHRIGRLEPTLDLEGSFLPVTIDHVLTSGREGRVSLRPTFGSDHRGVVAEIPLSTLRSN